VDWKKLYNWSFTPESGWKTVLNPDFTSHNFIKSPLKLRYNEGDLISSYQNAIPDINFTGVPITVDHMPCGYWGKYYEIVDSYELTSKLYPIVDYEYFKETSRSVVSGIYRLAVLQGFSGPENITINHCTVISGIHKIAVYQPHIIESMSNNRTLISGIYKDSVHSYSIVESLSNTHTIVSGIFKTALITGIPGPENFKVSECRVIGGIYEDA
jgi:hypothetical protein